MELLRYKIGIALALIGVSLGMFLNYQFPGIAWSPIVMFVSCLCMMDYNNIGGLFRPITGVLKYLFLFQLLMIVYWFATYQGEADSVKYLSFHLYIFVLIAVINSNNRLREVDFVQTLFVISGFLAIIFAAYHYTGIYEMHRRLTGENYILEVFTMDMPAYANLVCCITMISKKKKWLIVMCAVMVVIDFYVIIASGKRSYFISVFVALLFFVYKTKHAIKTFAITVFIFLLVLAIFAPVREAFLYLWDQTISGLTTTFTDKSMAIDVEDSASYRAANLNGRLIYVAKYYSLFNYIFGYKYLFAWIDNPLLESYLDMGIAGLFFYVSLVIIYPIRQLKKLKIHESGKLILVMMAVVNITTCITNNNPYEYFVYTPLCLMAIYSPLKYKRKNVIKMIQQ